MGLIWSNTVLKILIGAAVIIIAVGIYFQPSGDKPCSQVSFILNHSAVFSCPLGLSTVSLRAVHPVYASVTTNVQTEAWLTAYGDTETLASLPKRLGAPAILGPGAFLAVGNGQGLVYISGKSPFLVSVVWDAPSAP